MQPLDGRTIDIANLRITEPSKPQIIYYHDLILDISLAIKQYFTVKSKFQIDTSYKYVCIFRSDRKRDVVRSSMVIKIPIILHNPSSDEEDEEDEKEEKETSILNVEMTTPKLPKPDLNSSELAEEEQLTNPPETGLTHFDLSYPWARSDTFDQVKDTETTEEPGTCSEPHGGVSEETIMTSPLTSLRHPTERGETGDTVDSSTDNGTEGPSSFSLADSNISQSFENDVQYIVPQVDTE